MFEEVYGLELMRDILHDEWDACMKRCARGPTYHETVQYGAVFPWQRREFEIDGFYPRMAPPVAVHIPGELHADGGRNLPQMVHHGTHAPGD